MYYYQISLCLCIQITIEIASICKGKSMYYSQISLFFFDVLNTLVLIEMLIELFYQVQKT